MVKVTASNSIKRSESSLCEVVYLWWSLPGFPGIASNLMGTGSYHLERQSTASFTCGSVLEGPHQEMVVRCPSMTFVKHGA
jgi:hypothetical protein